MHLRFAGHNSYATNTDSIASRIRVTDSCAMALAGALSGLRSAVLANVRLHVGISSRAQQTVGGAACLTLLRGFAEGTYLDKGQVTERILDVVKNFDKVEPSKVSSTVSVRSGEVGVQQSILIIILYAKMHWSSDRQGCRGPTECVTSDARVVPAASHLWRHQLDPGGCLQPAATGSIQPPVKRSCTGVANLQLNTYK